MNVFIHIQSVVHRMTRGISQLSGGQHPRKKAHTARAASFAQFKITAASPLSAVQPDCPHLTRELNEFCIEICSVDMGKQDEYKRGAWTAEVKPSSQCPEGGSVSGVPIDDFHTQEDELLRRLISELGPKNWSIIAAGIEGRSGKSCRLRYADL